MAADGFMAAINAFISQNYGAGQLDRVKAGYRSIMKIVLVWGSLCTLLLVFLPGPIFRIFLNDDAVLPIGIDYLRFRVFHSFLCVPKYQQQVPSEVWATPCRLPAKASC